MSPEETKHVVEQAKYWANTRRHEKVNKPVTEGIEVFGPADFNQLAASIVDWADMLLNGAPFTKEVEQCRLEIAVQPCRTQAALLENIAAGSVLEQHHGTGRFNLVFLLQTLWLAFDLKSDSVLREALLNAVKVLYPNTRHGFIEQIISDQSHASPIQKYSNSSTFFFGSCIHAAYATTECGKIQDWGAVWCIAFVGGLLPTRWLQLAHGTVGLDCGR